MKKKKIIIFIGIILAFLFGIFILIKKSPVGDIITIQRDYPSISKILDKALLSDDPYKEFELALPKIKQFSSVEDAYINGNSFFVHFKGGGPMMRLITHTKDGTPTF